MSLAFVKLVIEILSSKRNGIYAFRSFYLERKNEVEKEIKWRQNPMADKIRLLSWHFKRRKNYIQRSNTPAFCELS